MTRQQYLSGVTRAGESRRGDGGRGHRGCSGCTRSGRRLPFAERAATELARDYPDRSWVTAGCRPDSSAAHLRRVGACVLDPARHQKYDLMKMQLQASLTKAATACLGDGHGLRREQPPPPQLSSPSLEHEAIRVVAPRWHARAAIAIDMKPPLEQAVCSPSSSFAMLSFAMAPPPTRGARDRLYGPRLVPSMFSSPTKPKREN